MKELNELVERSNEIAAFYDNSILVDNKTILAIAEAFRALEQRAEAAEEKLAEYEKQEPAYYATGFRLLTPSEIEQYDRLKLSRIGLMKLFTRPAPAVSLAELVPEEWSERAYTDEERGYDSGWNDCRAAILRNIEEAK